MKFTNQDLKRLWKPNGDSSGEDNGQITIIGGSRLFHGAPMLAVKAASRLVDMVFFGSPEQTLEKIAKLNSFIWVPWKEVGEYVNKSEAVLIGPGFMRFHREGATDKEIMACDEECQKTKKVTQKLLLNFPDKQWVIDGGSLQILDPKWIPKNAVVTPNKHEYVMLFGEMKVEESARKYKCIVVYKGPVSYVSDGETTYEIEGGNAGLTKGGTGDVLAGVIVGLAAKNPPLLAAAAGTYILKKTAEQLYKSVGYNFNADDVAESVFTEFNRLIN